MAQRKKVVPDQAIEMWNDGKTIRQIADHFGYSSKDEHGPGVIRRLIREHFFPDVVWLPIKSAKVDPAKALQLWNDGLNLRQIQVHFPGASRMAVSRAIRRAVARGIGTRRAWIQPTGAEWAPISKRKNPVENINPTARPSDQTIQSAQYA